MAASDTSNTPKTAFEQLCEETGIEYTDEHREQQARIQNLARLAETARLVDEQLRPDTFYYFSTDTIATPEIKGSRADSHSIACERHPWCNEDASFALNMQGRALVGGVFDGLGGYSGSERASKAAAETAISRYIAGGDEYMTPERAAAFATEVLVEAEARIDEDYALIATTAAMASIHTNPETGGRFATIAWAGDSRVYVIRNGQIVYRTLDDGSAGSSDLLDEIYPDEPEPAYRAQAFLESCEDTSDFPTELKRIFHDRNYIENCLGGRDKAIIHTKEIDVQPGDIILASSDGVHDNLTNKEILAILTAGGGVQGLTEAARLRSRDDDHARHKPDDITAVILRV